MNRILTTSSAALILAACVHSNAPANEATMTTDNPDWTRISVADGSANVYRFTRDSRGLVHFVYLPVTPEQSSTGHYSGGAPLKEEVSAKDARLAELWTLVRTLAADQTRHTPDRAKGTGAITWESPSGKREFIIPMGADLNQLLKLLKRFGS